MSQNNIYPAKHRCTGNEKVLIGGVSCNDYLVTETMEPVPWAILMHDRKFVGPKETCPCLMDKRMLDNNQ